MKKSTQTTVKKGAKTTRSGAGEKIAYTAKTSAMPHRNRKDRVRKNTSEQLNREIDYQFQSSIEFYSTQSPEVIEHRLKELDEEWDIERALEVNMSSVALSGLALGAFVNRKWFGLSAVVLGFFAQHAIQGWCPPLPIFRKLGYRTRKEIERERYALKALRGDFDKVDSRELSSNPYRLMTAFSNGQK